MGITSKDPNMGPMLLKMEKFGGVKEILAENCLFFTNFRLEIFVTSKKQCQFNSSMFAIYEVLNFLYFQIKNTPRKPPETQLYPPKTP